MVDGRFAVVLWARHVRERAYYYFLLNFSRRYIFPREVC